MNGLGLSGTAMDLLHPSVGYPGTDRHEDPTVFYLFIYFFSCADVSLMFSFECLRTFCSHYVTETFAGFKVRLF